MTEIGKIITTGETCSRNSASRQIGQLRGQWEWR